MSAQHEASCDTCGFDRRYKSEAKAAYALRQHSCAKQTATAESRERHLAREAAIDRTPKPCLHKQANHQHGTNAAYILDRCRCNPCARAHAAQESWRKRQRAYGRYDRYVDADAARGHVRSLMEQGMGLKRIVAVSGVPQGAIWKLMYGKRRGDGTQTPSKRILRTTHDRIMATELDLADGAIVPAHDTGVRLRALVALGYSISELGRRLGIERGNMTRVMDTDASVVVAHARAAEGLYDELSMLLPPQTTHRERQVASRSRKYAKRRGWLPPLALDEDLNPLTADVDEDLDEQAIFRRMRGDTGPYVSRSQKRSNSSAAGAPPADR